MTNPLARALGETSPQRAQRHVRESRAYVRELQRDLRGVSAAEKRQLEGALDGAKRQLAKDQKAAQA